MQTPENSIIHRNIARLLLRITDYRSSNNLEFVPLDPDNAKQSLRVSVPCLQISAPKQRSTSLPPFITSTLTPTNPNLLNKPIPTPTNTNWDIINILTYQNPKGNMAFTALFLKIVAKYAQDTEGIKQYSIQDLIKYSPANKLFTRSLDIEFSHKDMLTLLGIAGDITNSQKNLWDVFEEYFTILNLRRSLKSIYNASRTEDICDLTGLYRHAILPETIREKCTSIRALTTDAIRPFVPKIIIRILNYCGILLDEQHNTLNILGFINEALEKFYTPQLRNKITLLQRSFPRTFEVLLSPEFEGRVIHLKNAIPNMHCIEHLHDIIKETNTTMDTVKQAIIWCTPFVNQLNLAYPNLLIELQYKTQNNIPSLQISATTKQSYDSSNKDTEQHNQDLLQHNQDLLDIKNITRLPSIMLCNQTHIIEESPNSKITFTVPLMPFCMDVKNIMQNNDGSDQYVSTALNNLSIQKQSETESNTVQMGMEILDKFPSGEKELLQEINALLPFKGNIACKQYINSLEKLIRIRKNLEGADAKFISEIYQQMQTVHNRTNAIKFAVDIYKDNNNNFHYSELNHNNTQYVAGDQKIIAQCVRHLLTKYTKDNPELLKEYLSCIKVHNCNEHTTQSQSNKHITTFTEIIWHNLPQNIHSRMYRFFCALQQLSHTPEECINAANNYAKNDQPYAQFMHEELNCHRIGKVVINADSVKNFCTQINPHLHKEPEEIATQIEAMIDEQEQINKQLYRKYHADKICTTLEKCLQSKVHGYALLRLFGRPSKTQSDSTTIEIKHNNLPLLPNYSNDIQNILHTAHNIMQEIIPRSVANRYTVQKNEQCNSINITVHDTLLPMLLQTITLICTKIQTTQESNRQSKIQSLDNTILSTIFNELLPHINNIKHNPLNISTFYNLSDLQATLANTAVHIRTLPPGFIKYATNFYDALHKDDKSIAKQKAEECCKTIPQIKDIVINHSIPSLERLDSHINLQATIPPTHFITPQSPLSLTEYARQNHIAYTNIIKILAHPEPTAEIQKIQNKFAALDKDGPLQDAATLFITYLQDPDSINLISPPNTKEIFDSNQSRLMQKMFIHPSTTNFHEEYDLYTQANRHSIAINRDLRMQNEQVAYGEESILQNRTKDFYTANKGILKDSKILRMEAMLAMNSTKQENQQQTDTKESSTKPSSNIAVSTVTAVINSIKGLLHV